MQKENYHEQGDRGAGTVCRRRWFQAKWGAIWMPLTPRPHNKAILALSTPFTRVPSTITSGQTARSINTYILEPLRASRSPPDLSTAFRSPLYHCRPLETIVEPLKTLRPLQIVAHLYTPSDTVTYHLKPSETSQIVALKIFETFKSKSVLRG